MPPPAHLKSLTRVPLSSGASESQRIKRGEPSKGSPFCYISSACFRPNAALLADFRRKATKALFTIEFIEQPRVAAALDTFSYVSSLTLTCVCFTVTLSLWSLARYRSTTSIFNRLTPNTT
jgi:hypothetical protein